MKKTLSKLILWSLLPAAFPLFASGQTGPCPSGPNVSNAATCECYTKAQIRMNKRADEMAARAANSLRSISPKERALYSSEIVRMLEKAAREMDESQARWKAYRDEYCDAVMLSYTTGSGAGTAYEQCLYDTAEARVHQFLHDFPGADAARSAAGLGKWAARGAGVLASQR